jgi:hypothetical protein
MSEGGTPWREEEAEGSPLPAEMMVRYQGEMQRRAARREPQPREVIGRVLLIGAAVVGLVLAWRLVVYSLELATYVRLAVWGAEAQGIVLRMRTMPPVPAGNPARRIVTYGFWAGQQGVIQQEDVGRDTFLALYVDGPVAVVYAPKRPETSRIARELGFPAPWGVIALLAACAGLGYGGVQAVGWAQVKGTVRGTWQRWRRESPRPGPPPLGEGKEPPRQPSPVDVPREGDGVPGPRDSRR